MRINNNLTLVFISFIILNCTSCVRRSVTITSQPQGAGVYLDNKYLGETPVETDFLFYGGHRLELTKPGYENYRTTLKLKAPIYQYVPLDFISECILPLRLHDAHSAGFVLREGATRPPAIYEKKVETKEELKKEGENKEEKDEKDKLFE